MEEILLDNGLKIFIEKTKEDPRVRGISHLLAVYYQGYRQGYVILWISRREAPEVIDRLINFL